MEITVTTLIVFALFQIPGTGMEPTRKMARPNVWMASIAVNRYPHLAAANDPNKNQLRFCLNDEEMLYQRMQEAGRLADDRFCRLVQDRLPRFSPTKQNIERELPEFLQRAQENDIVLLYLSMHGAKLPLDTRTSVPSLLPEDFDPQRPLETSLSMGWLRDQICRQTRARRVVLLMDACHSGGIQSPAGSTSSKDFFEPLDAARDFKVTVEQDDQPAGRNIYVLASCTADETSLETGDTQHGLFTHWLICGMEGAADGDENGLITMDELFNYTEQMVPRSAEYMASLSGKPKKQSPQRFMLAENHSDIVLMAVPPVNTDQAFRRLSTGVDTLIRHSLVRGVQQPTVLLCEFRADPEGLSGGPGFGSFPRIAREKMEESLLMAVQKLPASMRYGLADVGEFEEHHPDMQLADLQQGRLGGAAEKLQAVVYGSFRRAGKIGAIDDPDRLCITVKVRSGGAIVGMMRTSIAIDRPFYAMFGGSSDLHHPAPVPNHPEIPVPDVEQQPALAVAPAPATIQEQLQEQEQVQESHPLRNSRQSILNVRILQGDQPQRLRATPWDAEDRQQPNLLAFPTRSGRYLTLDMVSQSDEPLAVVVQIDGVNQIGRNVAPPHQSCYWSVGPRASWRVDQWLDHPGRPTPGRSYQVAGGRMQLTAPPDSVAGRQNLRDSLGEIRIVVYGMRKLQQGERGKPGDLGVGETADRESRTYKLQENLIIDPQRQLATYVIHYYDELATAAVAEN